MPRPSRRDDVLRAASARFFRDGITATGVDRVVEEAGVAKMTLYGNFGSKEELVVAYLEDRDQTFFERLDEELATREDLMERALTIVDLYRAYAEEEGFHGCAFVNANAELAPDHPGRRVIIEHKRRTIQRWEMLIEDLGVPDAGSLTEECAMLLEGAFVRYGLGLGGASLEVARHLIAARLSAARGASAIG